MASDNDSDKGHDSDNGLDVSEMLAVDYSYEDMELDYENSMPLSSDEQPKKKRAIEPNNIKKPLTQKDPVVFDLNFSGDPRKAPKLAQKIRRHIENEMDIAMADDNLKLQIRILKWEIKSAGLWIVPANKDTHKWLINCKPYVEGDIIIKPISSKKFRKPQKITFKIRKEVLNLPDIKKRLSQQNRNLQISLWKFYMKARDQAGNLIFECDIPDMDLKVIKETKSNVAASLDEDTAAIGVLFYKLDCIPVKYLQDS
ncbi:uncharacterized protein LOC126738833 [Anthonomus grandis grandis]|uniref:uncharacterized protein LOC126738833 n=1 Tax=Anthonomus grandis grandis TaxID=2921223 RepID=UPI002164F4E0|nr:uncharacterized protein LOC126738833 [Anthonomus grandis grandis]